MCAILQTVSNSIVHIINLSIVSAIITVTEFDRACVLLRSISNRIGPDDVSIAEAIIMIVNGPGVDHSACCTQFQIASSMARYAPPQL